MNILAALWGFAEATLFFIVPDVLLSWLGLRERRGAFVASGYALIGALLGGVLMYRWGAQDLAAARALLDMLPGIDVALLDAARQQLQEVGALALFKGGLGGVPYKTYAIHAAAEGVGLALFLLVSVFARWLRFALVMLATRCLVRALLPQQTLLKQQLFLLVGWVVFYAVYFGWLTR
jgi:membrane protein YqaA with SNARE-associated domain